MNLRRLPVVTAFLVCACMFVPTLADGAPAAPADLRDLMTVSQFHQAGLDKLTPDELAALNGWFNADQAKPAAAASDLRDLMSVNQFHQAGLDKLTPAELSALSASLEAGRAKSTAPSAPAVAAPVAITQAAPASVSSFGIEMVAPKSESPDHISTRIPGLFLGWDGSTVFRFENGQIWEQAEPGKFETHIENAQVVIKKLAFGYLLTIPGRSETVFIRRLH